MKKSRSSRRTIPYLVAAAIGILLFLLISGYVKSLSKLDFTYNKPMQAAASYPDTRFAVISDLHYYDPSLGTTGPAFEKYLNSDRKLLADTPQLLAYAIDDIIASDAKFVLIPGDLTKDGELICHQKVSALLSMLVKNGLKVYVVPGNHDINNPEAYKYEDDKTIPVPSITASQFTDIYGAYGYDDAIYRDDNSLSYVAEPVKGLWLVAMDSCRYKENKPGGKEIIGGKLSQGQEKWLEDILQKAGKYQKAVMVMEHHGILEHWKGQSRLHPDYLVEDYKRVSRLLASYGVRLAFTGHYHAQDITYADYGSSGFIYDIETGSLSTFPCAVRYCSVKDNKISVASRLIAGRLYPGTDFESKSRQFVYNSMRSETYTILRRYYVPEKDANYLAGYVAAAFLAHYCGDENEEEKPQLNENKLGLWSRLVYRMEKYVPDGLWKDLKPHDNDILLDLNPK